MKLRILMFAILIALMSFSCSVTINSTSSISFMPKNYDFGRVIVNDFALANFKLVNYSGNTIKVTSLELVGTYNDNYSIVAGANVPFFLRDDREHIVTVKFIPKSEGNRDVKLVAAFNEGLSTTECSITGFGSIEAIIEVDPSSYDYEDVGIGSSVEKAIKISNKGNFALDLNSITIENSSSGNFAIVDGAISDQLVLNPGNEHTVIVEFSPTTLGAQDAVLRIAHSSNNSPFDVSLNGNGTNVVSVSPSKHEFGTVDANSTTDPFTFTITNPTSVNISLKSVSITGADAQEFSATPNGSMTVLIPGNGGSTEVKVTFSPQDAGSKVAVLRLGLTIGVLNADLSGEGVTNPIIEIKPTSFDFGAVSINSTQSTSIMVTNTGNAPLLLSQIQLQDNTESSYRIASGGNPNTSIDPGMSHAIKIEFTPTSTGDKFANLRIDHDATNLTSPLFVSFSGLGSNISFQPSFWDFGDVGINPTPAPKKLFTVRNDSNVSITIQQIQLLGANPNDFAVTPSGTGSWSVEPGKTYPIEVACRPTVEGPISATLQLDLSLGSPLTATLNANGIGNPIFKIIPASIDFGIVEITKFSKRSFTISNIGTGVLRLSQIEVVDAEGNFSIVTGGLALGEPIINLNAGESHYVLVNFEPLSHGDKTAKVHIVYSGIVKPEAYFNVALKGNATGPEFELIPMGTSFSFGHQIVGNTYEKSFYIRNSGDKNLVITNITKTGNDYSIDPVTTPLLIEPGHISVVNLYYQPSSASTHYGSLIFTHNSVNSPYVVSLTGTGLTGFTGYYENFDGSSIPSGWSSTGDWEWGVQTTNGPTSTHTPTKCWATRLNRNYRDNQYCYVVSKTFDLTEAVNPKAEFWLWLRTRNYYNIYKDGIWMEISTDGGNTWSRNVNPTPAYNSSVSNNIPAYVGETSDGWEKITMDISAAAGKSQVLIAWYFYSDQYLNSYGAFVDTFSIYDDGSVSPYNPTPVDNDINVKYTSSTFTLRWESTKAVSYDVYFGTSNPPTTRVANDTPNNYFAVPVSADKKYYWRIIANTGAKAIYGPVWCFHTVTALPKVMINEIDTIASVDWVEIYNADTKPAHIGGWQFITYSDNNSYEDGIFEFPDYLVLQPGECVVIHDNQATGEKYITDFNINWGNSTSPGEVLLLCPDNYDIGVDYMRFNTLLSHKPSDLNWTGAVTSNYTSYSNFYRRSNTDTDDGSDWYRRYRTADKGSKNPGQ